MAHSSGWETTNPSPCKATTGGTRRGQGYQEARLLWGPRFLRRTRGTTSAPSPRGGEHGRHLEDWEQAEQELKLGMQ